MLLAVQPKRPRKQTLLLDSDWYRVNCCWPSEPHARHRWLPSPLSQDPGKEPVFPAGRRDGHVERPKKSQRRCFRRALAFDREGGWLAASVRPQGSSGSLDLIRERKGPFTKRPILRTVILASPQMTCGPWESAPKAGLDGET